MPNVPGHVLLIVDESGSMTPRRQDTVAGMNDFIRTLRLEQGVDYNFSLMFFDSGVAALRSRYFAQHLPLAEVYREIAIEDYKPSGMTPLFDAVNKGIHDLAPLVREGETAVVVIFTDGAENASAEVRDIEALKRVIAEKESAGWRFVYIGIELSQWGSRQIGSSMGVRNVVGAAGLSGERGSAGVARSVNSYYAQSVDTRGDFDFQASLSREVEKKKDPGDGDANPPA